MYERSNAGPRRLDVPVGSSTPARPIVTTHLAAGGTIRAVRTAQCLSHHPGSRTPPTADPIYHPGVGLLSSQTGVRLGVLKAHPDAFREKNPASSNQDNG
ncbi:hypothetical protein PGTUg99_005380 [Puccinia graminis f. sp. tritici]|uniref:Uncharacterized protein n=1 Tax=Puccinia graminis f. sp. tritici TaxID=56615 RepID=A0A5B0RH91_PUCGR|nr:hypothetical protein PGTUg99_005380 [Puccinia graminis f. sp. tritici]